MRVPFAPDIGRLARVGQGADSICMARILVVNPNSSLACSDGISSALAPFRLPGGPRFDVVTLREGPPAIYDWRDWHGVVEPLCRLIEREPADAYMVACASDPGIEAARATTTRPVFGVFRCAVAAAVARGERFGVIAIVDASKARHLAALRAMGLEHRLAAEVALNVTMDALLEPDATRARLIDAARSCAGDGADTVILGCTGMALHRAAVEDAVGLPVIEPCQAAAAITMTSVAREVV
jgi:Asp/Glu/hydantoin racemase